MVDISAIAGLTQSIGAIRSLAKAMLEARDAGLLRKQAAEMEKLVSDALQRAIDTQGGILTVQQELAAVLQRERGLEAKVAELENWNLEKERYELKEVSAGAFAYVIKEAMRGEEPVHWLCAACYQKRQPSILQSTGNSWGVEPFQCPVCKAEISRQQTG